MQTGGSELRCYRYGFSQHVLGFNALPPRADCRRDFGHLSGRAIGPRDLFNDGRAQPNDGFIGSPRTPQLHAYEGRDQ